MAQQRVDEEAVGIHALLTETRESPLAMNRPAPPRHRPLRRFLQFRIRTMLILMTLVAIGLSVHYSYLQHYEEQQEAAAALAARGVALEWEPMRPAWLRNLLSHGIDEKLLRDCVTVHGRAQGLKDDDLVHLKGLKHLKNLYLERNRITDEGLAHLSQLRTLERLSLWGNAITDDGLRHLASLPALEVLDIHGVKPNAISGSVVTSGSRSIGKLDVKLVYDRALTGPLTPSCLEHLQEIRSLRALDFSFAVDEEGLRRLATFPKLRVRTLLVRTVSLDRLAPLRRLPDLETLVLDRCLLDPEAVLYLANLPRLANLELRDTEVNDGAELSQLVQLKHLSVVDSPLGDRAFAALGRLKGLKSLWLSGTGATDANIAHLGGCTNLELLDLGGEKLTADALNDLGSLRRLSTLVIDCIPLDDEAVHSLAQMDSLTRLGPRRQNAHFFFYLSPAGVAELAGSTCATSVVRMSLQDAEAGADLPGIDVSPTATPLSDGDLARIWDAPLPPIEKPARVENGPNRLDRGR